MFAFNGFFVFFFSVQAGEGQREGARESEADSMPTAASPMQGSNSQTTRSRPEPKLDAQLTEPPRRPIISFFLNKMSHVLTCQSNFVA